MASRSVIASMLVVFCLVTAFNVLLIHSTLLTAKVDESGHEINTDAPRNAADKNGTERVASVKEASDATAIVATAHRDTETSSKERRDIDSPDNDKPKPKLFLHVGPRKTATTTIQNTVLRSPDYVAPILKKKDNIVNINYDWMQGLNLVEGCLQETSTECDMDHWNGFISLLDDAHEKRQNAVVSNEALSLVQATDRSKKLFLSLTKDWDVRIIIAYRSLETWYPSMYYEDRAQTIFKKINKQYRSWAAREVPDPCNDPISSWFNKNWKKVYLGDPIQTLDAYNEIFGEDKVKTLMMISPDKIDITQQFVCDALEAKHGCEYVKKRRAPMMHNKKDSNSYPIYYDNDLLVMGAYSRGWLKKKRSICKIEHRFTHSKVTQEFKQEMGIRKIEGLPKVCVSKKELDELNQQSWLAQTRMSTKPMSREEFDSSFTKVVKTGKFCSVDVTGVLSDPEWESFFKTDERLCIQYRTKDGKNSSEELDS